MQPHVRAVAALPAPGPRARQASRLIEQHQAAIVDLSRIRRESLDEMLAAGMTHAEIAEEIGVTRARVGQLFAARPPKSSPPTETQEGTR